MGWLIAALVIALILFLKISVRVDFADDMTLYAGIGIFRIKLLPSKPKTARLKDYRIKRFRKLQKRSEIASVKKDKTSKKKAAVKEASPASDDTQKPDRDILGLVGKLTDVTKVFLSRFGHHLRIDLKRLVIIIGTGDAAKTAVLYGAVCGGVQCLLELLYNCMHLHLQKGALAEFVRVEADFLAEKTVASADVTFSFRIWQLFDILVRSGVRYLQKA